MRNKIVAGLIAVTGVLFVSALFTTDVLTSSRLFVLGFIAGMSAIATRFLIKENA